MEKLWLELFGDNPILKDVSPYVVIGIIILIMFIYKLRNPRTSTGLMMQILGVIIGVIIMYCIVWYTRATLVVEL